jgi:hypothetical protein
MCLDIDVARFAGDLLGLDDDLLAGGELEVGLAVEKLRQRRLLRLAEQRRDAADKGNPIGRIL